MGFHWAVTHIFAHTPGFCQILQQFINQQISNSIIRTSLIYMSEQIMNSSKSTFLPPGNIIDSTFYILKPFGAKNLRYVSDGSI